MVSELSMKGLVAILSRQGRWKECRLGDLTATQNGYNRAVDGRIERHVCVQNECASGMDLKQP